MLTRFLSWILTIVAGKKLDKLMKTNPDVKKGKKLIDEAAEEIRTRLEKKYGKEYADKVLSKSKNK